MTTIREAAIAIALLASLAAITVVTIVSGADSLPTTGLKDIAILLGGALAGVSLQKP